MPSTKKFLPIVLAVVVVLAGAGIYLVTKSGSNEGASKSKTAAKYSFKKACDILTPADAKQLLGDSASGGTTPAKAATDDIDVSTCAYTQSRSAMSPSGEQIVELANILVRGAKTEAGAASNAGRFGPQKPASAQDVSGYGDKAYWDPAVGQLNILKHHNWYILSYGRSTERTFDHTKLLADLVIDEL